MLGKDILKKMCSKRYKIVSSVIAITVITSVSSASASMLSHAEQQIVNENTILETIIENAPTEYTITIPIANINKSSITLNSIKEIKPTETEIKTEPTTKNTEITETTGKNWPGHTKLTKSNGVFYGPSGKETYYNLEMKGVVNIMRSIGFDENAYPYWVRSDGVKMLGDYIMVAADLDLRPRGTILECSLGTAIVCDTGDFIYETPTQLDIAVNW